MNKLIVLLISLGSLSSAFADTAVIQVCIGVPNSNEQICTAKTETGPNTYSYQVSISDYGQTITVDSAQSYPLVDASKLQQGMESAVDTGFNAGEMAHYSGPVDDELKAVADGTLSAGSLRLEANTLARGLSQHTPAN